MSATIPITKSYLNLMLVVMCLLALMVACTPQTAKIAEEIIEELVDQK